MSYVEVVKKSNSPLWGKTNSSSSSSIYGPVVHHTSSSTLGGTSVWTSFS